MQPAINAQTALINLVFLFFLRRRGPSICAEVQILGAGIFKKGNFLYLVAVDETCDRCSIHSICAGSPFAAVSGCNPCGTCFVQYHAGMKKPGIVFRA